MYNRTLSATNFKNLWLFLPMFLFSLYGIQGVVGFFIFKSQAASQFVGILTLGILTYMLTYILLRKYWQNLPWLERIIGAYQLPVDWWIKAISGAYFLFVIYAVMGSEKIALWEAINGASSTDIANARETLFKVRTGWEQSLIYFNSLFSSALMPFVLVVSYLEKKSYRHILLALFVISLLPSLEKALAIKAFLPLIVVAFNGYLSRRSGYLFIVLMVSLVIGTTYLTKMGKIDPLQQANSKHYIVGAELTRLIQKVQLKVESGQEGASPELQKLLDEQAMQAKLQVKYFPFGNDNQVKFMMNRILWIPYITAYDWLGYFHEKMHDEHLNGRTSLVVSALTGQHQYSMEKEVFIYQFGANGPPTAAANAIFLVDAFVNFGWFGVALFAALIATLTRLIDWLDNPAAKACYFYFAYQVALGGLFGVLFSNGLLLLLMLALFMKPRTFDKYVDTTDKSTALKTT